MTEKMPSSVRFGSRPMMPRMRWYSSAVRPCSAMRLGVIWLIFCRSALCGHMVAGIAAIERRGSEAIAQIHAARKGHLPRLAPLADPVAHPGYQDVSPHLSFLV